MTRTEQNRLAQQARRDKLRASGLKALMIWVPKNQPEIDKLIRDYAEKLIADIKAL